MGRIIDNVSEVILILRQAESFGETKWDFRFNRQNLSVAIIDRDWLSRFQAGEIDIRPGDALHVQMKETISYDANGEVVNEEREVVRVIDVIRKQE